MKSNTIQAYNASSLTVNDGLVVNETLTVDTITQRLANEVTVSCDLALGGTLLVGTIDTSFANQITVKDNVVIGTTTTNKNLTVYGNLSLSGSLSGYSPFWAAARIDGTISTPTVVTRKGDKGSQITCVRHTGNTIGVYDVSWTTAHTDGANYIVMVSGEGASYSETLGALTTGWTNTSTQFTCVCRKLYSVGTEALVDCPFTFYVLK